MANTTTTVATGVAETVATTVATDAKTAATAEVTSLSTHWHIPVWAVLVVLAVAAVAVLHFI
jgi:disulfide bond formation protein DsbB